MAKIRIIAEEAMQKALRDIYGGECTDIAVFSLDEPLLEGDKLITYAHSNPRGGASSSWYGGLQQLERVLARKGNDTFNVVIIGWLPLDRYGKYSYLVEGLGVACVKWLPAKANELTSIGGATPSTTLISRRRIRPVRRRDGQRVWCRSTFLSSLSCLSRSAVVGGSGQR